MRLRLTAMLAALALLAGVSSAWAQQQTGQIYGKVTDESGAVLPGVTVTLTGPSMLQPQVATSSETGTFQFPRLEIGSYDVKFELPGFKTVIKQGIRVTVGLNADVSTQLSVSTMQETVTVTGESPIVDTKETGTKQTFTLEQLQSIPSARDPWVILQQTAGIAMDRENIGGNMSGQQSNFVSRGANPTNTKWSVDGIDTTDMAATGASPTYYDFDAFGEISVSTGGVDVTQQTGGVGVNLVTKSGTDKFRGSGRFYRTNDKFESNNITDAQRQQGATSGNPIQDIKDYGVEAGGPIKKGKAWIWGSYGKQNIGVGFINFYQPTAECQAFKDSAVALASPVKDVNDCLNTDLTVLKTTNLKGEWALFQGNKLTLFNSMSAKQRNARGADDLHPIETTQRQDAVPSEFGTKFWRTGPSPTYKFGDQWVLSDRTLIDVQYSHVGNNFILDFHDPTLADVQPTLIISNTLNGRSGNQSVNIRPVNSVNLNMNYFMPAKLGGDHQFKIGGYWRDALSETDSTTGGHAIARFQSGVDNDCLALSLANPVTDGMSASTRTSTLGRWCQAQLTRDGQSIDRLTNIAAYVQDTMTRGRATLQLGVRYDRNHDQALASSVGANPILPEWLPAISFTGADPKIIFNNFSPRLGLTYDLRGNGKTVAHGNYARYYGQVGNGTVAGQVNPAGSANVRFPWNDANGDKVVQANEVAADLRNVLSSGGNYDPANPGFLGTANTIDPNLKNDTTDEFIVGLDHELGRGVAVGANYIWRRYTNFQFTDTIGLEPSDYTAVTFQPTCPGTNSPRCDSVTYFQPNFAIPSVTNLTNFTSDQYNRTFNGFELTGRKRMSNHWMMNTSFSYNDTIVNNGFAGTFANGVSEDPTNRTQRDGFQYDYATSGSGIGNVFINAKWLFKLSGMYQLPYAVNVSAFYNARQGYPFEATVQTPTRPNRAGTAQVLLDGVGENRLPTYQNLDLHFERPIVFGAAHFVPSVDIFNLTNNNTIQAIRGIQTASNANNIQAIVAPRVLRFGIRVNW